MKKIFAFLGLFACILTLVGCSKVSGKTYVYESFTYELADDLSTLEEIAAKAVAATAEALAKNNKMVFDPETEGDLWSQDGSKVIYGGIEYKVKGSKLIFEKTEDGCTYVVTYKVLK